MFSTKTKAIQLTERQHRIFDFIDSNRAGVLASVDPDGEPHGVVIYHVICKKDFSVCFLTKTGTKKYDNLVRNNHVMLVVFEPTSQTVAQVIGRAEELTSPDDINAVATEIAKTSMKTSQGGIPPIAKLDAGDCTAFKINPVQIRMASYMRPDPGDYSHLFESIESFELKPGV